jgi:N-carbamoyl-L-amino-acid hydrolase
MGEEIQRRAPEIARQTSTEISILKTEHDDPAIATPAIQSQIEAMSAKLGLKTMRLPSGAGHDAQNMAKLGPMGMIFVPSVAGISHSPKELTLWPDCANGANVLLHTILGMDRN